MALTGSGLRAGALLNTEETRTLLRPAGESRRGRRCRAVLWAALWTALWEGGSHLRTSQGCQALLHTLGCQSCFWVCVPAIFQELPQPPRVLGEKSRWWASPTPEQTSPVFASPPRSTPFYMDSLLRACPTTLDSPPHVWSTSEPHPIKSSPLSLFPD